MKISITDRFVHGDCSVDIEASSSGTRFMVWRFDRILISGDKSDLKSLKILIDKVSTRLPDIERKVEALKRGASNA